MGMSIFSPDPEAPIPAASIGMGRRCAQCGEELGLRLHPRPGDDRRFCSRVCAYVHHNPPGPDGRKADGRIAPGRQRAKLIAAMVLDRLARRVISDRTGLKSITQRELLQGMRLLAEEHDHRALAWLERRSRLAERRLAILNAPPPEAFESKHWSDLEEFHHGLATIPFEIERRLIAEKNWAGYVVLEWLLASWPTFAPMHLGGKPGWLLRYKWTDVLERLSSKHIEDDDLRRIVIGLERAGALVVVNRGSEILGLELA